MKIKLNNTEYSLTVGTTLLEFLTYHSLHEMKGTAVAINGSVIPRKVWEKKQLENNDSILMITASQGG